MASSSAYQIGQTWRESRDTNALVRRAQSGDADAAGYIPRTRVWI